MRKLGIWIVAAALLSGSVESHAEKPAVQPQTYDEVYWAAKWARWEAACNHLDAIQWFEKKYGTRFEVIRSRYAALRADMQFPKLPNDLMDGTVWSCRIGHHTDQERKFARILKDREFQVGLRSK